MRADIDIEDLRDLIEERDHLRAQVDELQERNTELVERARTASIRTHVAQFHRVMGQPILDYPQVPPEDRVRMRLRLIAEEFFEALQACEIRPQFYHPKFLQIASNVVEHAVRYSPLKVDLPALADALCDLDYVVEGTRLEFGIDGLPVLLEVQRANLAKVGGGVRADGKIQKPEGWQPPDIARVLREQRWSV